MLNINLTDNVVVIEPDPVKLDAAIHTALDQAREVLRQHYLNDLDDIPPIEVRVSTGRKADNSKNGAHVAYHLLSPPSATSLLAWYVELLDQILNLPARSRIPAEMISQTAFGAADKINRWVIDGDYVIVLHHALKAVFVSLLKQGVILLPGNLERYMPFEKGVWRGFDLMPDRLKEMAAVYYAGSGLKYGVDWSLCTYGLRGLSIKEQGIEQIPARGGKTSLVHLAMCTRWEHLDEIDPSDIDAMKMLAPVSIIGLYLTYLYLKAPDKELAATTVFPWVEKIPSLRIYVEEFALYARKTKDRRSTAKRLEEGKYQEPNKDQVDRRTFEERIHDCITEATKGDRIDSILLARSIGRMSGRSTLRPNKWPQKSVLPDSIPFDLPSQSTHWLAAFRLYEKMSSYSDMDMEFYIFAPFMHYLMVYLPIYFHENPDSAASYPTRVEELNGFHFISRPIEVSQNLPLPFVEFVREYYRETSQMRIYTAIKKVHQFFRAILGRRELLGIPASFVNPVMDEDIPGTGGRPTKTTKERLPRKAYWLALLYAYKIYDYVSIINQKCLDDAFYADRYSVLFHNLDQDELGLIDIRDILNDDEAKRVVTFEQKDYEVNLVPSCFFMPVELPLKGMSRRFIIRPHAITHLICTLETGIRNQGIQWLSYDFDKDIRAGKIDTEDVYQLFVMTDKSNKSWTATTSGRVIKLLREMRIFRDLVDEEAFDREVSYEGRKERSPYPSFKVLFAFNGKTGNPYSDSVYEAGFRYLLAGLQNVLDHFDVDFRLFEYDDSGEERKWHIKPNISPHSMRVTVVGEYTQFLCSAYVGKYITNQKLATVWYYTKYDAETLRKMEDEQKRGLAQFNREKSEVRLIGNGPTTIDATDPNSYLAKAFLEDPAQAIVDFGAVSSHFFDRETGIAIVTSNNRVRLAFEPTHICPFGRICPADRVKEGRANRCNLCDYAIRTVDHLPAIGCRRRDLMDEMERLEAYCEENASKLTEGQELDIDARLSVIGEDVASIELVERILENNRQRLLNGEESGIFHVYQAEIISKKLEPMLFPDPDDPARHILARAIEAEAYPDHTRQSLQMNVMKLAHDILANTNDVRTYLKRGGHISRVDAEVFSLVNSIKIAYGLTYDQLADIANGEKRLLDDTSGPYHTLLPIDSKSAENFALYPVNLGDKYV